MGSLAVLATRLRSAGPPSLSHLVQLLSGVEHFEDFLELVRQYLPECEAEILLKRTVGDQVQLFTNRFSDRYFPLHDGFWIENGYEDLTAYVPLILQGISWDDYHEIAEIGESWRPGYQLLFTLAENPFEVYEGARVPLLEACAEIVPQSLVQRIPAGGYAPDALRQLLEGTEFEGAAAAADWLCSNTGTLFLDWPSDAEHDVQWTPENIRELTEEWQKAKVIIDRLHALAEWLEVNPPQRFGQLLDFIDKQRTEREGC